MTGKQKSSSGEPVVHGVDQGAYKIVSVRLREAEFIAFSDQVSAFGLTNNLALRMMVRRIGGFLEVDNETLQRLQLMLERIGELSRHLAALQETCQQTRSVDLKEVGALRASFGRDFAQLDARLATILNVSKRRADGRLLLAAAVET
ncbi:type IV secretion system T-DNA border endonuclease VirD1 [Agrobacterium larrymoorei]|uniref:Type IV secretion system T-DNA border endonuclease VirD1 n=1 Tax=Agrobacterium larrymoorei TaxID=160699 RepID=A0AAJ2ER69_9HYPH|nr:DNA mobilization endonuclease VirD1/MobC family subunit [Agrobacterium larrymoorei]MDR6101875.1 type IV secretion system T-DNA border endonuclease VirD1 [Agrobacterium larrymoorei]